MKDFRTIQKETREKRIKAILDSNSFSKKQLECAKEFNKHLMMVGVKDETRRHYLTTLKHIAENIPKEFKEITKKDIENYIVSLKRYAEKTQRDKKIFLKSIFFAWLYSKQSNELELVNWIKLNEKNNDKLPEEILTEPEIKKMVQVGSCLRDKAIIFSLYESGCRKGEFLGLKIKHVSFDDKGAVFMVDGKTGSRRIRLIDCVPDLVNWLNTHPNRDDPDAPLWITLGAWKDRPLGEDGLKRIVKITALRAGIKKRIYPHLFRHARATILAKDLTEQEMKIFFGWTSGSNMPSIYVHLSGKDVEDKLLAIKGLKPDAQKKKEVLKPIICPFCNYKNSGINKFCSQCSRPLRNEDKVEILKAKENILNLALGNNMPINKKLVKEIVKEMIKEGEINI